MRDNKKNYAYVAAVACASELATHFICDRMIDNIYPDMCPDPDSDITKALARENLAYCVGKAVGIGAAVSTGVILNYFSEHEAEKVDPKTCFSIGSIVGKATSYLHAKDRNNQALDETCSINRG
ncbi:MAG: hypothetical protein HON23_05625 [Rickettsiales bacterium]|jgi:hypothetical protein|nr:hypothetical protein [Rickettsiales bacterium]